MRGRGEWRTEEGSPAGSDSRKWRESKPKHEKASTLFSCRKTTLFAAKGARLTLSSHTVHTPILLYSSNLLRIVGNIMPVAIQSPCRKKRGKPQGTARVCLARWSALRRLFAPTHSVGKEDREGATRTAVYERRGRRSGQIKKCLLRCDSSFSSAHDQRGQEKGTREVGERREIICSYKGEGRRGFES